MPSTNLGRVLPIYKGEYNSSITYERLDNVYYNGNTYISLIDNNQQNPTTSTWQLVASKGEVGATGATGPDGPRGATGAAAGFGNPVVSTETVSSNSSAEVVITASGENTEKVFSFNFKIPRGPAGSGAVSSVDGFEPDSITKNVDLKAVSYGRDQTVGTNAITPEQAARARNNINAQVAGNYQVAGDYIVSPSEKIVDYFLKYAGNNEWVTEAVNAFPGGGAPGYVLKKTSSATEWAPAREVIAGGAEGALLSKASNNNYDLTWANPISTSEIDNIINN